MLRSPDGQTGRLGRLARCAPDRSRRALNRAVHGEQDRIERVLFVASEMEARGTNEYVVHMAGELRRRGVAVRVFCAPGPMLEVLRHGDVPVETFECLGRGRFRRAERKRFVERLADFSPQIVHAQTIPVARLLTSLAGETATPVVLTVHTPPRRARAFRCLAAQLAGIIATTQDVREELVNNSRVEKSRIAVIANGIDVDKLGDIRPIFSGPAPVVGSLGPAQHARGQEVFLRAASQVAPEHQGLHFVVAGEGKALRKLSGELGLDSRLTFVADFSSYAEVLAALDVVVQTAQVDVSGFSILDAMGHGRPVIAFNTGTACEIVQDGKTGILLLQQDAPTLAEAIRSLVEDRERARRMGREARRVVAEKFNIKKVAEATLAFYASRLAG